MDFCIAFEKENANKNCSYAGFSFEKQYIIKHFPNEIRKKLIDYQGTLDLVKSFETVANTDFDKTVLEEIFSLKTSKMPAWRIGEAFGEFFLQENFRVRFWYNHLRDLRNPNASDAGTDLVGFVDSSGDTLFVFGEVKTSEDQSSPPNVVYGRTGLRKQIDELCNNERTVGNLIRYLGFKVRGLRQDDPFYQDFHRALGVYIKKKKRIHLFGLLVRDKACNNNDLQKRYDEHEHSTHRDMIIKFLGLYVPIEMGDWESIVNGGGAAND